MPSLLKSSDGSSVERRLVAVHQPNYLPWLGYFAKIHAADVFIFYGTAEHSKRSRTRRTSIPFIGKRDSRWLTVPLRSHPDNSLINDLMVEWQNDWTTQHLRHIKATYQKAPFFSQYFHEIQQFLQDAKQCKKLSQLNIFLIKNICQLLKIDAKLKLATDLPVVDKGSNGNLQLVKSIGGTSYLSGMGGQHYNDEPSFQKAHIQLVYSDFASTMQTETRFLWQHSILDALFNIGVDECRHLLAAHKAKILKIC